MAADEAYLADFLRLDGKVALVTGAKAGIGRALALGLARAGAAVAVTSREGAACDDLVAELRALGTEAVGLGLDVRSPEAAGSCVDEVGRLLGPLSLLVNNAGVAVRGPAATYPEDSWDLVFDTNLKGAFVMSQAAAAVMRGHGGGRIVNISSTYAHAVRSERVAYSVSKAGLDHLTRVLALEWAPDGIHVNGVTLTTVRVTGRSTSLTSEEAIAARIAEIPLGRLGVPEDAVPAVLFLAAGAGGFVTGHTIRVDGGFTLG